MTAEEAKAKEAAHKKEMEQALMLDASFSFKEGIKSIIDKLVTKIPFKKIEDEYTQKKQQ